MKPINFNETNKILGKPQDMTDYKVEPLSVYTDGWQCVSCWKMTLKERLSALFFGRIWVDTLSGGTQPPMWIACSRTIFGKEKKE